MKRQAIAEALRDAIAEEMARDETVFCIGEDIAVPGGWGGAFTVTLGLEKKFPDRMINTPIAELGFFGVAVGAALMGMKPIADVQYGDFLFLASDQIINNAAKMRYMSGGDCQVPLVMRAPVGATGRGSQHAQNMERYFTGVPGLKVVAVSNAYDAKGILKAAVRDNNPVLVLEAELLYSSKGMVEPPDEELLIPLGQAEVKREGSDVTIICYAQTVPLALTAAEKLEEEDISSEIVDLRSIKPLDEKAIFDSIAKTHRVVIVEHDRPFCGVGAEVCYRIQKNIFDELDAPIIRVAQEDVPMPYNEKLEKAVLPNIDKLMAAVKKVCYS